MEIYSKRLLLASLDDSPVKKGEVIFEKNTAGMYSVDIPADGLYEIIAVGGGGRGKAGWGNPVVQQGGAAGLVVSYDKNALVSSSIISNGNSGTFNRWYTGNRDGSVSTAVVQSPYPPYGSGSAGSATTRYSGGASFTNSPGSAGYVKIIYYGK